MFYYINYYSITKLYTSAYKGLIWNIASKIFEKITHKKKNKNNQLKLR